VFFGVWLFFFSLSGRETSGRVDLEIVQNMNLIIQ
jgi:hypothetical protein